MAKARPVAPAVKPARAKRAAVSVSRGNEVSPGTKAAQPTIPTKPIVRAASLQTEDRRKVERGRFTLPTADFNRIAALKARAGKLGRPAKKNELLRIGLRLLTALSDESLLIALDQLEPVGKKARRKKA